MTPASIGSFVHSGGAQDKSSIYISLDLRHLKLQVIGFITTSRFQNQKCFARQNFSNKTKTRAALGEDGGKPKIGYVFDMFYAKHRNPILLMLVLKSR